MNSEGRWTIRPLVGNFLQNKRTQSNLRRAKNNQTLYVAIRNALILLLNHCVTGWIIGLNLNLPAFRVGMSGSIDLLASAATATALAWIAGALAAAWTGWTTFAIVLGTRTILTFSATHLVIRLSYVSLVNPNCCSLLLTSQEAHQMWLHR